MIVPRFQILIASVYARHQQLESLLSSLSPQLLPFCGAVSILVDFDDCIEPIGEKRTRLVRAAHAGHIAFIDDDDRVSDDYVASIVAALRSRPDYVGFMVDYYEDGVLQKPVIHNLDCGGWYEDAHAYWRDISHLNPVYRPAALKGLPFLDGFGEDCDWASRVRLSGCLRRQVMVPRVLYEYRHSTAASLFGGGKRQTGQRPSFPDYPFVDWLVPSGQSASVEA